jgi:hypothetical protein
MALDAPLFHELSTRNSLPCQAIVTITLPMGVLQRIRQLEHVVGGQL